MVVGLPGAAFRAVLLPVLTWHMLAGSALLTPQGLSDLDQPILPPPPPLFVSQQQALRKPWRQELVKQLSYAAPVTHSSLTHLATARQAAEEGIWTL